MVHQTLSRMRVNTLFGPLRLLLLLGHPEVTRDGGGLVHTVMWSIGSLLLRSGHHARLGWWTVRLFLFNRANAFLVFFLLLYLLGLVARSGTAMHFWYFVVGGTLFLALLLGLPTACNASLHLLCIGRHELQAFPTGKTAPVMPDNDVIRKE